MVPRVASLLLYMRIGARGKHRTQAGFTRASGDICINSEESSSDFDIQTRSKSGGSMSSLSITCRATAQG